jgi:DNA-binding response OmpR family regulator
VLVVERSAEHLLQMLREVSVITTEKLVPVVELASALMDLPPAGKVFVVAAEAATSSPLTGPPRATRPRCGPTNTRARLTLDLDSRVILEFEMAPLLTGEVQLLQYLGAHAGRWFSSLELARNVYRRSDASARQLVWKYASTLKRKLLLAGESSLQVCRKRGYSCSERIVSF